MLNILTYFVKGRVVNMKTVVITGAAKGIGLGIAELLIKEGYNVIINYNKSEKKAKEIEEILLKQNYNNFRIYKADITSRDQIKNLFDFTIKEFKSIDVLINNAGIDQIKQFIDITDRDWNNIINTNLNSIFYTCQEVLKYMLSKKKGLIINISSIWGITGGSCEVHYSVSKAGVDGLTKSLAKELGPSNIRVNSIAPGMINTDMNKNLVDEEVKEIINNIPLERIGEVIDIAKCVKWLIEDNYTTGQVIQINGGWKI